MPQILRFIFPDVADRLIQRKIHSCWGQLHLLREQKLCSWTRDVLDENCAEFKGVICSDQREMKTNL